MGRIRALLICGANPVHAIPDMDKVLEAFRALDLLVVVEPFETATTKMADYVLPPKILYELNCPDQPIPADIFLIPFSRNESRTT